MTEIKLRRWLVKMLKHSGCSVERNESGALNEGYPDLTISRNGRTALVELKQGRYQRLSNSIVGIKYRPRQPGKLTALAVTNHVRIFVVVDGIGVFSLRAPLKKFNLVPMNPMAKLIALSAVGSLITGHELLKELNL